MLTQAYAAVQQIQSQISTINRLQELKALLKPHKASLFLRISSPTLWVLEWDICESSVSGTLELRLDARLLIREKEFLMRETPFRLEDPNYSLLSLEARLIGVIKQFVEDIWLGC